MKKIGVTLGDPAGIGPEIVLKLIKNYSTKNKIILYGSFPLNIETSDLTIINSISEIKKYPRTNYFWFSLCKDYRFKAGHPSKFSGIAAYEAIKIAGKDALQKDIAAIVTAPISKSYIQKTYPHFIGHTEFFAEQSSTKLFVMSFFSKKINLALLTTHLALKNVSKNLSQNRVEKSVKLIDFFLKKHFKIDKPKIALLALNPHRGESGSFGREEIDIFTPTIKRMKRDNIIIEGPFSADTFFVEKYKDFDITISPYHDQGLVPFKLLSFGKGVNVTIGLPYIRTSVDHGTAFNIAGNNKASISSIREALQLAEKLIK